MNRLFPEQIKSKDIEYVNGYPVPPVPTIRPFKALTSIFKLLNDVDETKYVYDLFQAVSGKAYRRGFESFSSSNIGKKVLAGDVVIESILSDKDWLQSLPQGTVGRCYFEMVKAKDFSVDGLLIAARHAGIDVSKPTMFEAFRRYFIHFEVTHDLWHVLTGYDTDPLGELCLLEFYRAQWPDIGLRILTLFGALSLKMEKFSYSSRFKQAFKEAYKAGLDADSIQNTDIDWMLTSPLTEVRRTLKINEPCQYRSIPHEIRSKLYGGGPTVKGQHEPVFEVGWAK